MTLWVINDGCFAQFSAGSWSSGAVRGTSIIIGGLAVVGAQRPGISAATGGTTIDVEARASIGAILAALRGHGLIAP